MSRVSRLCFVGPLAMSAAMLCLMAACEERDVGEFGVDARQEQVGAVEEETATAGVLTEQRGENLRQYIYFPTGERETSYLMIEKTGPATVRVGQEYRYTISLTNISNTQLAGVAVRERLAQGMEIGSSQPQAMFMGSQQQMDGEYGRPMLMSAQGEQQVQQTQEQQLRQQPRDQQRPQNQQQSQQNQQGQQLQNQGQQNQQGFQPLPPPGQQNQQRGQQQLQQNQQGQQLQNQGQQNQQGFQPLPPPGQQNQQRGQQQLQNQQNQQNEGNQQGFRPLQPVGQQAQTGQPATQPTQQGQVQQQGQARQQGLQQQGGQPGQQAQQQDQRQQQQQAQGQQQGQGQQAVWQLGEVNPGETRTIQVTAYADTVGEQQNCIMVDFKPTLCTATRVINPQITISKSGPQVEDICDPIVYTYTVSNTGTGIAQNVRVEDPLAEGLMTGDGQRNVTIQVGNLAAGESKSVQASVIASRTGEFSSRAVAMSANDRSFSSAVATRIVQPDLELAIEAPERTYVNERATYRVIVSNRGDSPAVNTTLHLTASEGAALAELPTLGGQDLTPAARGQYGLGTIDPGQSRTVSLAFSSETGGMIGLQAVARAVCDRAPEEAIVARDMAETVVATIPALLLEVVDEHDPVQVGNNTIYSIDVKNQGSGADTNIQLMAQLPAGMEFVEAYGPTEVNAQGNRLTFSPLQTLAPGDVASWQVEVKAVQPAQTQFRVQLNSDALQQPARETEPTRMY